MAPRVDELAARDGWVCWLCEGAIDPTLPANLAGGATVDHVVPRSRGGSNDLANLRLAHRRCNGRRGSHLPELDWPGHLGALDATPLWVAAARVVKRGAEVVAVLPTRALAEEAGGWACARLDRFLGGTWAYDLEPVGTTTDTTALRMRVTGPVAVPDVGRPKVSDPRRSKQGSASGRRRRR
jgi:hypothetical protein